MVNIYEGAIKDSESATYSRLGIVAVAAIKKSWAELHRRAEMDARLVTS
jgi:hypothetical protein